MQSVAELYSVGERHSSTDSGKTTEHGDKKLVQHGMAWDKPRAPHVTGRRLSA